MVFVSDAGPKGFCKCTNTYGWCEDIWEAFVALAPLHGPPISAEALERLEECLTCVAQHELEWLFHLLDGTVAKLELFGEAAYLLHMYL